VARVKSPKRLALLALAWAVAVHGRSYGLARGNDERR
jgi:hypothetical protein